MVFMALFLFGNSGFQKMVSQWLEKRRLVSSLVRLRAEHEDLVKQLAAIQKDPAYTEYLIRKNLGYVKKGEVEYHVIPRKSNASGN